jgi:hypothetical protein
LNIFYEESDTNQNYIVKRNITEICGESYLCQIRVLTLGYGQDGRAVHEQGIAHEFGPAAQRLGLLVESRRRKTSRGGRRHLVHVRARFGIRFPDVGIVFSQFNEDADLKIDIGVCYFLSDLKVSRLSRVISKSSNSL